MSSSDPPARCARARAWLSAYRDGEELNDAEAAAHVASCPACTAWGQALDGLTGRLRVRPATSLDLVGPALAAWDKQPAGPRRRVAVGRLLLGLAGLLGWLLAASRVAGVPPLGPAISAHAGRELAAFEAALSVGFVLAAWRPRHADGLLAVAVTVVGCTLVGSAADVLAGRSQLGYEVAHLPLVAGLVGLLLARPGRPPRADELQPRSLGDGRSPPARPATDGPTHQ